MAITNHERVGKALEQLNAGLQLFVEREPKSSERKGWAEEAGFYNSLVVAWPAISQVPELFQ